MLNRAEIMILADFAAHLCRLGGDMALHWVGSRSPETKADDSPVTDADHAVQAAILDAIATRYPAHAVLVEETLADPARHRAGPNAEFCWVIDPIDGTRNFARRSRAFATSVGLLHHGVPLVGAIYDGRTRGLYHAARGHGAFLDDRPIHVSSAAFDSRTIMAISSFRGKPISDGIRRLVERVLFRNLGSLCLHLVGVACGDFDGLYSHEAKAWDISAGCLLIEEAGGRATAPSGAPIGPLDTAAYSGQDIPILAAGEPLHSELARWLHG